MQFISVLWQRTPIAMRAVLEGLTVLICGALGWSAVTFGSLKLAASLPSGGGPLALFVGSLFLWGYWRYLNGAWWPRSTAKSRQAKLRANGLPGRVWAWSLIAGALATVTFVALVRVWGRVILLQPWTVSGVSGFSFLTALSILVGAAAEAGIVEEAAFRGYMQRPIEKQYGPTTAIIVVSIIFGLVHLANPNPELTWLVPYTIFGAILGVLAYLTKSIVPGILLHSGLDAARFWLAWRGGRPSANHLIWQTGPDSTFWASLAVAIGFGVLAALALRRLAAARLEFQLSRGNIAKSAE
jgi:uncharacterized protein